MLPEEYSLYGLIAQWIEHLPSKPVVVGSSPTQSDFQLCEKHMTKPISKAEGKQLLGEMVPTLSRFQNLDTFFTEFHTSEFRELSNRAKFKRVNKTLLQLIQEQATPCFLLAAVLEYIERVTHEKLLEEGYTLTLFELWLNQFSGLSVDEMLSVRGKIVGRFVPREEYQVFFPVGMGRIHPGSHFVAAHLSPDVDTTTASFWGWMDAFGCRLAEGTHQWSLPSGLSDGHIMRFMRKLFGEMCLTQLSRPLPTMTLSAMDLLSRKNFHVAAASTRTESIDYSKVDHAVVVVDHEGLYRGEWHSQDAESVHQIVSAFSHTLRWFEGTCQARFIRAFAQEHSTARDIATAYTAVFDTMIKDCAAVKELPEKSKRLFQEYLKKVLHLSEGMVHTFRELFAHLDFRFASRFSTFVAACEALQATSLFDAEGRLQADRVKSAKAIERVIEAMEVALESVRSRLDTLEHLLEIKERVFNYPSTFVTLKSDVDEMRAKIGHFEHLTVVVPEKGGKWFPVGIVLADDLKKPVLGTVSFRDFSNPEETKMASYIDVISIVDHHKTRLQTSTAPTLLMGDTQSSNTLVAEQSLQINRRYGSRVDLLHHLIEKLKLHRESSELLERLEGPSRDHRFFVDSKRELSEYFSYIYGILDDTDLLSRVSRRDVLCVKALLDRMRSIAEGAPAEAVSFAHIPNDHTFVRQAANTLLQNPDLHSIYSSLYRFREHEVEQALIAALQGLPTTLFLDTKEQNSCCRVGQTKLFHTNLETFTAHKEELRRLWQSNAEAIFTARPHIDFFLQMLTTVSGEREVFLGEEARWQHQDEIWIWPPDTGVAEQHLVSFLNNFQGSPTGQSVPIDIELIGPSASAKELVFSQNFPTARSLTVTSTETGPTMVIFRFPAGAITTRKAQISPYLPKVLP